MTSISEITVRKKAIVTWIDKPDGGLKTYVSVTAVFNIPTRFLDAQEDPPLWYKSEYFLDVKLKYDQIGMSIYDFSISVQLRKSIDDTEPIEAKCATKLSHLFNSSPRYFIADSLDKNLNGYWRHYGGIQSRYPHQNSFVSEIVTSLKMYQWFWFAAKLSPSVVRYYNRIKESEIVLQCDFGYKVPENLL